MRCPDCKAAMTGHQYRGTPEDWDGVSEWDCPSCQLRIGRWTGKRLKPDELEPRYGVRRQTVELSWRQSER